MARPLIRSRAAAVQPVEKGGLYFLTPKENVEFIQTGCTLLDCVLGGGWALGRIANIVGDRSTGKTLLALEAMANFLRQYPHGIVRYNECEAAFDTAYARALGVPFQNVKLIENCDTVEAFFKDLDHFLEDDLQPKLYILDSLDALSSSAEQDREIDAGSYGDGKAKKMSEVFRRMAQKLSRARCCLIIISQVRDNIGVTFGDRHTRSGGKALDFYASQILWLAHLKTLTKQVNKISRPVGLVIRARCRKNKVGLALRECEFEVTFGYGVEDEKASLDWLKAVGKALVGKAPEKSALDAMVVREWYAVEKTFLPQRRKYGDEDG